MNKIQLISNTVCILAGSFIIFSCNEQDENELLLQNENQVLKVEADIAETRAIVTSTSFKSEDKIGIYVTDKYGNQYVKGSHNIQTTYDGSIWNMQKEVVLNSEQSAYVFAYYPFNEDVKSLTEDVPQIEIDVTPDISVEGQADYLYANVMPLANSYSTAVLKFRHALARVTLAISKGDRDNLGESHITNVKLANADLYKGKEPIGEKDNYFSTLGYMNLESGSINRNYNPQASLTVKTDITASKNVQYIDLLVIPVNKKEGQTNYEGGGIDLELTIDEQVYKLNLGYPNWYAGKQYTYPVTINRKKPEVFEAPVPGEAIDLGLSSGLFWADRNVGAKTVEEYGYYYAWGETESKDEFNWEKYNLCEGTANSLTKYNATDKKNLLDAKDDVAYIKLEGYWRMPTQTEFQELLNNCSWTWTTQNSITGYKITGPNGKTIFLPAAGYRENEDIYGRNSSGYYWTSSIYSSYTQAYAYQFNSSSSSRKIGNNVRCYGFAVRPVYEMPESEKPQTAIELGNVIVSEWGKLNEGGSIIVNQ